VLKITSEWGYYPKTSIIHEIVVTVTGRLTYWQHQWFDEADAKL
jgi:hypothetical protein